MLGDCYNGCSVIPTVLVTVAKRIARNFIDGLLDRIDLVATIHQRVPLKKAGKDYQACCPFHNEKTPSFTVVPNKGFYYCFGCGAKGNAIGFLMGYEHLSFPEAIEKLAEENNISVEYEHFNEEKAQRRKDLYDVLEDVARLYENNLFATLGQKAKAYLHERQLDAETTKFFRLGYSQTGNNLQRTFERQFSDDELLKVGLLGQSDDGSKRYYDQFRDRLMFPIRDPRGRVLGFGARALGDAKPKYLNSTETEVFSKRYVLYGLYEELQTNRDIEHLIVVEGYMDVIALHQMGVHGAVATLGTSLTPEHVKLAQRYTKKIFICFDGDRAGKKAARRAMDTLLPAMSMDLEIRMVFLPDGEDPDTLVRKDGKDAFLRQLHEGQLFSEFVYTTLIADSDLEHVEDKGAFAIRVKALFDQLPDSEYKGILYLGLIERVGFDVYQLAQRNSDSHWASRRQTVNKRQLSYGYHGNSETRLIRLLLEFPALADYVNHLTLLVCDQDDDTRLLGWLISFFQTSHIEQAEKTVAALSVFDGTMKKRLNYIHENERLPAITQTNALLEDKQRQMRTEFMQGIEQLLNRLQRKNIYH